MKTKHNGHQSNALKFLTAQHFFSKQTLTKIPGQIFQRQDFWKRARAPRPPNFLGSQRLGSATSRVLSYLTRISLISCFDCSSTYFWQKATRALAMLCRIAQICDVCPPPFTLILISTPAKRWRPNRRMGSKALQRRISGSISSIGHPLILIKPRPRLQCVTATAVFFRPKH